MRKLGPLGIFLLRKLGPLGIFLRGVCGVVLLFGFLLPSCKKRLCVIVC